MDFYVIFRVPDNEELESYKPLQLKEKVSRIQAKDHLNTSFELISHLYAKEKKLKKHVKI